MPLVKRVPVLRKLTETGHMSKQVNHAIELEN